MTTSDNFNGSSTAISESEKPSHPQDYTTIKSNLAPATLEALKTLSTLSSSSGIDDLAGCEKLTASLEQIRARRNMNLFGKLDAIRQDFSGLNHKIAKIEESIIDLKETTSKLVESLPKSSNVELKRSAQ